MPPHYPKLSSLPSYTAAQASPSLGSLAGLFLTMALPLPEVMRLSKTHAGKTAD